MSAINNPPRTYPFKSIQNYLRGSNNPHQALSEIRPYVRERDFELLINWLPKLFRNGQGVFQCHYPHRLHQLRKQPPLVQVEPHREIIWAKHILNQNSRRISEFLALSRDFEQMLTCGSYTHSGMLLDELESKSGISLWSIENRIALLQLSEGLEKQKAYSSSIKEMGGQPLVAFIAFYVSQRNEATSTIGRFTKSFSEKLRSWGVETSMRKYLLYRLTNQLPQDVEGVADILGLEGASSIVDYYDSFIRLAQNVLVSQSLIALKEQFLEALQELGKRIDDIRIQKMLLLANQYDQNFSSTLSSSAVGPIELNLRGRWKEAAAVAQEIRAKQSGDSNNWFVEAYARAEAGEPSENTSLSGMIVNFSRSVILKNEDLNDSIQRLSQVRLNFRLARFSYGIEQFLSQELSSVPVYRSMEGLRAFLDSYYLDFESILSMRGLSNRQIFGNLLIAAYPTGPALDLVLAREGLKEFSDVEHWLQGPNPIHQEAFLLFKAEKLFLEQSYLHVLEIANQLERSSRLRVRRLASRFKAYCLLQLSEIAQLVEYIADSCLADQGLVAILPIRECVTALDKPTRATLASRLSTSIVLDLFARHIDDSLNNIRSDAAEDLLIALKLTRPSQLPTRIDEFAKPQLVYYLRHLCVPAVMEGSTAYESSRELEDERLAVVRCLTQIDPENVSAYEAEIRSITRNQMVHQGVRHVEQSKIFVDINAIRRWAKNNLKESFNRYKALLKAGIGLENLNFTQVLRDVQAGLPVPEDFLQIPKNEATELLRQIVWTLINECTLNPEHGLDCYLSMRIRHGTLSGQLRSPLEMEKIITQRDRDSQTYKDNEYWLSRLEHVEWSKRAEINKLLGKFSADYDSFIDHIAKELIQIRSERKSSGLFVVHLDWIQIRYLASRVKEDTDFDAFFEDVILVFWEVIKKCLANICQTIDTSVKAIMAKLFARLEADIADQTDSATTIELTRAIRIAQTNAQQDLARVKEWFRLTQPLSIPPLSLETLVDIGVQSVKNVHRDFDPIISMDAPDLPAIEGGLSLFSDMFFIIFENIQRHCGISEKPRITIKVIDRTDRLQMLIRNQIQPRIHNEQAEERVNRIRQVIDSGGYQSGISSEGGTGFIKLRKLLERERTSPLRLDFGFAPDDMFFVDLEVPVIRLQDEGPEEAGKEDERLDSRR